MYIVNAVDGPLPDAPRPNGHDIGIYESLYTARVCARAYAEEAMRQGRTCTVDVLEQTSRERIERIESLLEEGTGFYLLTYA